jgi:hypothetical protein
MANAWSSSHKKYALEFPLIANGICISLIGDQSWLVGYASDETEECMLLTMELSHQLTKGLVDLLRDGTLLGSI